MNAGENGTKMKRLIKDQVRDQENDDVNESERR